MLHKVQTASLKTPLWGNLTHVPVTIIPDPDHEFTYRRVHSQYTHVEPTSMFISAKHSACVLHWKYTQRTCDKRCANNHTITHPLIHTPSVPVGGVLLRPLRRQMCQNNTLVSLLFAVVLLCSYTLKNTESDLLCIMLMHFSQAELKTPCSSTLKSNLALPGLKAHVKLKTTVGGGMKNWVDPCINQVERN